MLLKINEKEREEDLLTSSVPRTWHDIINTRRRRRRWDEQSAWEERSQVMPSASFPSLLFLTLSSGWRLHSPCIYFSCFLSFIPSLSLSLLYQLQETLCCSRTGNKKLRHFQMKWIERVGSLFQSYFLFSLSLCLLLFLIDYLFLGSRFTAASSTHSFSFSVLSFLVLVLLRFFFGQRRRVKQRSER